MARAELRQRSKPARILSIDAGRKADVSLTFPIAAETSLCLAEPQPTGPVSPTRGRQPGCDEDDGTLATIRAGPNRLKLRERAAVLVEGRRESSPRSGAWCAPLTRPADQGPKPKGKEDTMKIDWLRTCRMRFADGVEIGFGE